MDLRQVLRAGVAAVAVVGVVAPVGAGPIAAPQASGIELRVAQADGFSRVEFHGAPSVTAKRNGQVMTLVFPHDADPEISRLRTAPPKWIKTAEKRHVGGHLQIVFTLTDDADVKVDSADGAAFINVFQKAPPTAAELAAARAAAPEAQRPNPIPAGGVVRMESKVSNAQVLFAFAWANPAGAAVFRRGDAVWVVFDAPATLDGSHAPRGLVQFSAVHATRGLALSPTLAAQETARLDVDAPKPASMPGLIDYVNWPRIGPKGFLARYNTLLTAASIESANKDKRAPTAARMALARFLVGSELSFEAIGVLNGAARASPQLMDSPEFRGLRGIARVMARRYKEAEADFSAPVLSEDRSSALWRSYIAAQLAQWPEARGQFARGMETLAQFSPVWKARFARGDAQAALAQGDLPSAEARIHLALADKTEVAEELATRLVQARVIEQEGHKDRALKMYTAIATVPMQALASPALLRATQIKLEIGKVTPLQAATVFDGLRYRWRGDATELETIRALGQLYLSQGRYREALEALRSAGTRLPDLPEALQLQSDLAAAFRSLFLDGHADGLEPIQALALFYDFKELTPIGSDGDLMVRKLVRRLVDVDLLDQAADLLKYQADNRLDGVPRAQAATNLAVIYLMDKKPEQAITAINSSRTTVLPAALNAERRQIEARAWAGVGKYDSALEILDKDASKEAADLRAEVTW